MQIAALALIPESKTVYVGLPIIEKFMKRTQDMSEKREVWRENIQNGKIRKVLAEDEQLFDETCKNSILKLGYEYLQIQEAAKFSGVSCKTDRAFKRRGTSGEMLGFGS